jgi:hypothetical protein
VTGRIAGLIAVVALAGVLAGCHPIALLQDRPTTYEKPARWVRIDSAKLKESSGVAPSLLQPNLFWTHNDSGDSSRLFLFGRNGLVREVRVEGARNRDWEDMASARIQGRPYLFIADIGDNSRRRSTVTIYRIPEPVPGAQTARPDRTITLRYPGGPQDAECLLVHPQTGMITLVTKSGSGPSQVFRATQTDTLVKIGQISLGGFIRESRMVTGGAISPDGNHVVLRTYMGAYEFDAPARFDDWVRSRPRFVSTDLDIQGEAITYFPNGDAFLTTSEGRPMSASRIGIVR